MIYRENGKSGDKERSEMKKHDFEARQFQLLDIICWPLVPTLLPTHWQTVNCVNLAFKFLFCISLTESLFAVSEKNVRETSFAFAFSLIHIFGMIKACEPFRAMLHFTGACTLYLRCSCSTAFLLLCVLCTPNHALLFICIVSLLMRTAVTLFLFHCFDGVYGFMFP